VRGVARKIGAEFIAEAALIEARSSALDLYGDSFALEEEVHACARTRRGRRRGFSTENVVDIERQRRVDHCPERRPRR
jgi:hypothetical protein